MSSNTGNTSNLVSVAISGVGGQGVLTLAEVLAKAALRNSHNVRVGEIHGMAQRGGHVICTVRIGPGAKGPIVDNGTADIMVGFEPAETLREIQLVKKDGHVLMNTHIMYPVAVSMGKAEYPEHKEILENMKKFSKNIIEFDAFQLAKESGDTRAMNMVMLGAIIGTGITPISEEAAIESVRTSFPGRFEEINIKAFKLGLEKVKRLLKS